MAITRSEKSVSKPISTPAVRPIKWKEVLGKVIVYILLTTGAIIFFAPWAWMVSASFQPIGQIFEWPPNWIPDTVTLQNYVRFLTAEGFFRWVLNSGFLAIVVLLVQMFFNSLAAYSFAKRKFPGRDGLFLMMLGTLMIPGQLFLIPNYLILLRSPPVRRQQPFRHGWSWHARLVLGHYCPILIQRMECILHASVYEDDPRRSTGRGTDGRRL